ncbi:MAG: glycosyltransferase family 2 protein, partial [Nitrospirae bacterium]|nr:glycosyltransferase family 2 protein [Nitrospirota bacterium]
MNKFLVSICIPTFNRAELLDECLSSIVCQFKDGEIKRQVEVIISDNCSTDDTGKVAKKYCNLFDNIKYFGNLENIGMVGNMVK